MTNFAKTVYTAWTHQSTIMPGERMLATRLERDGRPVSISTSEVLSVTKVECKVFRVETLNTIYITSAPFAEK